MTAQSDSRSGGDGGDGDSYSGTRKPRRSRRPIERPAFPALVPLALRLEQLRFARSLTQRALAERAGICTQHYQDITRANSNPTAVVLLRLAAALDVSISDLFGSSLSSAGHAEQAALHQLLEHVDRAALAAFELRALALFHGS